MAVYSVEDFNHELKVQFTDGNGKLLIASFGRDFEKGKWNELTAKIPENTVRPLKIDSIYCLYTEVLHENVKVIVYDKNQIKKRGKQNEVRF